MRRKIRTRTLIILAVTLFGLYVVFLPNPKNRWPGAKDFTSWSQIKQNLTENIRLGLDLRGGSHLVMQVQTDDVIRSITEKNTDAARAKLKESNLPFADIKNAGPGRIIVSVEDTSKNADIIREFENNFGTVWESREVGNEITFTLSEIEQKDLRERATEQALKIIENRVNAFGVAEPTIQRHGGEGTYQILIQMPGVDDPERVKNTLNAESNLELKLVAKGTQLPYATREEAEAAAKALPGGLEQYEMLPYRDRSDTTVQIQNGWGIVEKRAVVSGLDMRDARAMSNQYGGANYQINFSLTPTGAQQFGDATGKNIGERLAIVLNNEIKSAPTIQGQITDNGQITGSFTQRQAEDLALVLRSGALPARAIYIEERTVGPSLGADSIRQGVTVSLIGLSAVLLFMVFYYRLSGINAVIALLLNLVLLVASLVVFDATLTLPGIAGVILTIGMAVDSNILIFERIREELRSGKTVASAVQLGFDRAFLTIIDTHVTTVVSAAFLFIFGTGPIRGFAVTLVVGLLANVFTAVFVSKTIFMFILNRKARVETISI